MLFAGRTDAVAGVEEAIYKAARREGYAREQFSIPLFIKEVKSCVWFSRATIPYWQNEQQMLQDIVDQLWKEGVFKEIHEKWTNKQRQAD